MISLRILASTNNTDSMSFLIADPPPRDAHYPPPELLGFLRLQLGIVLTTDEHADFIGHVEQLPVSSPGSVSAAPESQFARQGQLSSLGIRA